MRLGAIVALCLLACAGTYRDAPAQTLAPPAKQQVSLAIGAIAARNYDQARALYGQIQDPLGRKLVLWFLAAQKEPTVAFGDIARFVAENPTWPGLPQIRLNAELSIAPTTPAAELLAFFAEQPPRTLDGTKRVADALRAQNKPNEAREIVRRAWIEHRLAKADEKEFRSAFKDELRPEDHAARIYYLLRHGREKFARDYLAEHNFDSTTRLAAETRLQMMGARTRHSIAAIEGNLAGIAKPLLAGDDFRYELARWYRRTGRNEHALPLIAAGTPSHELARQWWEERHIHVRHLLRQRQYQAAYELARGHKHAPGSEEFAEAEFLPGFIALRLLNQPRLAEPHFRLLAAKAPHAPDKARAHYWLGRGAEAQRDAANAQLHYRAAAQYPASFYGQLALGRISRGEFKIAAPAPRDPTDAAFYSHELVRAARFLLASGNTQVARWFLINAALHAAKTPAQHAFLAELAGKAVQPDQRHQTEVRLIRFAQRDGHAITQLGYPMLDLPDSNKTEPAMVHALIRQESEFLAQARSWVGARGLMQLMPQTAKMEAKEAKLPFSVDKLTADPKYNLTLGTNHLARLLDIYEGRYPLALAGYNAGVGATDRWLADFGDPRTAPTDPRQAKIDWIDWIELIPVDETRDYVKKVLENYAIYRLRFGEAIQIDKLVGYWREPEKLTAARQVCNEKLALAEAAKTIAKTTMAKTPVGPTGTKTAPVPPGQQIATMNADPKIMVKTPVGPTGTKNPQHLPDPPNLIGVNTTKLDVKC